MRAITLLLLALILVSGAATVTFQPNPTLGKDALTSRNYPDTNYRDRVNLQWGYGTGRWQTYIEFLDLNDTQYQGAMVNSAILELYVYAIDGNTSNEFYVSRCFGSWEEGTITWNNSPGLHGGAILQNYPSGTGWLSIDVTAYVQDWLDGTKVNSGFMLANHPDSDDFDILSTRSSDYTDDSSLRPKLVLNYSGAAVEEATWGQIKADF